MDDQISAFSPPNSAGTCITIGNFDGVHLGHQALLDLTLQNAAERVLAPLLITFWPHPRAVLKGFAAHTPLTTRQERKSLLAAYGFPNILELEFSPELAALSAEEFVQRHLLPLGIKSLVIGHDFTLGYKRQGSAARLAELGKQKGFAVVQADACKLAGYPVSSTRLRQAIHEGRVEEAAQLLGRNYAISGKVVHGYGRGNTLGFPTANLAEVTTILPANGVYAAYANVGGQRFGAVTNIGFNPTFGNSQKSIESFLLDASANLYDKDLRLEFVGRIRDEQKFSDAAALVSQINKDIVRARSLLL